MTTAEDVIAAIERIERAGRGGPATVGALLDASVPLQSSWVLDGVLDRLRAAYPEFFPPNPAPAAPPDRVSQQQGAAAAALRKAEVALAQAQSATAEFDRQVVVALRQAHKTTADGRRQLDDLAAEIDSGARSWDLSTPAGAREFQRFLVSRLRRIIEVVQDGNDDDTSKEALAAAWAALYASQLGPDRSAPGGADAESTGGVAVRPAETFPDTGAGGVADPYPDLDPEPYPTGAIERDPGPGGHRTPAAPALPPFGEGGAPPFGGLPGGLPGTLPLAGAPAGPLQQAALSRLAGEAAPDEDLMPADQPGQENLDDEAPAPEPAAAAGPSTVTLPNGEVVTAATPQLAAVLQAAADGTPVAEAFRGQGITIPPPGTAVAAPVDQSLVRSGDIGMFTDRHALALNSDKALLDGQIQRIANVGGPSFLGWQHPPTAGGTTEPTRTPTATRPAATVTAA